MNRLNWLRNLESSLRPTRMISLIGLLLILILPRNSYAQIVIKPSGGSGGGSSIVGGSCTNQAMIAIDTAGNVTCATITSAYVSNSIALTGTDINTSSQVTVTHLASALPFAQGGLGFAVAAVGDLIYASATNAINKLADITTGNVLLSGGVNTAPAYGKVTSSHVDSSVALTGSTLAQFASTSSAQLATLLSDETGSGLAVFGTSPTIVTPIIASFVNATHNHSNPAGGGTLSLGTSSLNLGGNAYDTLLGNTTLGHSFARGTITTSDPFVWSQTWNASGVVFSGLEVNITRTASATLSKYFSVSTSDGISFGLYQNNSASGGVSTNTIVPAFNQGTGAAANSSNFSFVAVSGTINLFSSPDSASNYGSPRSFGAASYGTRSNFVGDNPGALITDGVGYRIKATNFLAWSATADASATLDTALDRNGAGVVAVTNGSASSTASNLRDFKARHLLGAGTVSTVGSCGGSPTIAGTDDVGRATVGTAPSSTCVVTFGTAYTTAPVCQAENETTSGFIIKATETTTAVTFSQFALSTGIAANYTAGDVIGYLCRGY